MRQNYFGVTTGDTQLRVTEAIGLKFCPDDVYIMYISDVIFFLDFGNIFFRKLICKII